MEEQIILALSRINKSFGITKALDDVDLNLKAGTILGLIGENGSGKSTLASIVAGAQKADSGEMYLLGEKYEPVNMPDAIDKGISLIIQEQGTFSSVSAASNIFSGREDTFVENGILNNKKMNAEARKALNDINAININEKVVTSSLSFEERKVLEIARANYAHPKVLIVDETSAVLSKDGRDVLYSIMKKTRNEGNSVIFIAHDVAEMMEHSDEITILRDGAVVTTLKKSEFDEDKIKSLMIGRAIENDYYRSDYDPNYEDDIALSVNNISYNKIKGISFEVHKGEIFGIGGLSDCGMHELGKIIYGAVQPDYGTVTVNGELNNSPSKSIMNKCAYISKDRDQESLMRTMSIRENVCLESLDKIKRFGGVLTKKTENQFTERWRKELSIKMDNPNQYVMYLSGGNKQKVALARWMAFNPDVYIMDCPTRGIDVGAKAAIMKLIRNFKTSGKAIIIISEELPELIGLSDRIMIIKDGISSGTFTRSKELTEGYLIKYMI